MVLGMISAGLEAGDTSPLCLAQTRLPAPLPGLLDLAITEGRAYKVGVTHWPAHLPAYPA